MYTNYSYPINSSVNSSIPNIRSSYSLPYNSTYDSSLNSSSDRLIGGFAFPFLLGGVTGAALAPNFWRPPYVGRPPYGGRPPYYYQPYPPYYPRPYY